MQFHPWILENVPVPCDTALDVGCGDGVLTARLAPLAKRVMGIDTAASVIAIARNNVLARNVTFVEGDILSYPFASMRFDFIAAVAVLHHVSLEEGLARLSGLLLSGGVLAVVGLARDHSLVDYATSAVSVPVARVVRFRKGWWESPATRIDPVINYSDIRAAAMRLLPGVEVRRRLFFRHTLLWRKP